jgi:hypothetical protein
MNSKIANLLAKNVTNDKIVAEMISHICNKNSSNMNNIEDHLVNLCLGTNKDFITKGDIIEHIDKIQPLCMAYTKNIENVSCINVLQVDNIDCTAFIEFKAEVTAWFRNKEEADKGYSWYSSREEDDEHKIKGTYSTIYTRYIPFKDIDINID